MTCPACGRPLAQTTIEGVTVDVCTPGCGGIWFDQGELRKIARASDAVIHGLLSVAAEPGVHVDLASRRRCPKCPASVLMRHFSSASRAVTIDECPTCAGIWLDQGELAPIRSEYETGADRSRGARVAFEELLIDDRMSLSRRELDAQLPWDTFRSKILSSALVAFYLFGAQHIGMDLGLWRVIRFCILPLLCVWFPDELGNWTTARITRTSPRSFVWFFGWVVLLLPLFFAAVLKIEDAGPSPFTR